jgi:hypothetical protein
MRLFGTALAALIVGHGLHRAGLPEAVKQAEYDRAVARRAARRASANPTFGQWAVVVLFVLIVVGLIVQALG